MWDKAAAMDMHEDYSALQLVMATATPRLQEDILAKLPAVGYGPALLAVTAAIGFVANSNSEQPDPQVWGWLCNAPYAVKLLLHMPSDKLPSIMQAARVSDSNHGSLSCCLQEALPQPFPTPAPCEPFDEYQMHPMGTCQSLQPQPTPAPRTHFDEHKARQVGNQPPVSLAGAVYAARWVLDHTSKPQGASKQTQPPVHSACR